MQNRIKKKSLQINGKIGRKTNRKSVKGYKQPVHNRGNPKGECMERCPNPSILRATQTRTTRIHFTPVRFTTILGSQAEI